MSTIFNQVTLNSILTPVTTAILLQPEGNYVLYDIEIMIDYIQAPAAGFVRADIAVVLDGNFAVSGVTAAGVSTGVNDNIFPYGVKSTRVFNPAEPLPSPTGIYLKLLNLINLSQVSVTINLRGLSS